MQVKAFEVVAKEDPDESGTFKIVAGRGCLGLSLLWALVILALAVSVFVRACT